MPMYDYQCSDCKTVYDVFHKVREVEEDIVCPTCSSKNHVRLISAPSINMKGNADPPCGDGSCCGGSCGLN